VKLSIFNEASQRVSHPEIQGSKVLVHRKYPNLSWQHTMCVCGRKANCDDVISFRIASFKQSLSF